MSIDPFNEPVNVYYRKLLLPALANFLRLDGLLYAGFAWLIAVMGMLLLKAYLKSNGVKPTFLEEFSLLTCGAFATSFQLPGYPDIAVVALALVALIELNEERPSENIAMIAFALALMAHEAAAVIVFAPLLLFVVGRRSWRDLLGLGGLYSLFILANFSFSVAAPFQTQVGLGGVSAMERFRQSPSMVIVGALYAFKALWLVVPFGIVPLWRRHWQHGAFVMCSLCASLAATYIAVDYSRMTGFATIAIVLCFVAIKSVWPPRLLKLVLVANLLIPSFYVVGGEGVIAPRGAYFGLYRHLLRLPTPQRLHI